MRRFLIFMLVIAIVVLVVTVAYTTKSVSSEKTPPAVDQVATTIKKVLTFDDKKKEHMHNVDLMIDALHDAEEQHNKDKELANRAFQAYQEAVDISNASAEKFNELVESTKLTYPEAVLSYYSIDWE